MPELNPVESRRRDCMARQFLSNWSRQVIVEWLENPKRSQAFREDMRARLNRLKEENNKR